MINYRVPIRWYICVTINLIGCHKSLFLAYYIKTIWSTSKYQYKIIQGRLKIVLITFGFQFIFISRNFTCLKKKTFDLIFIDFNLTLEEDILWEDFYWPIYSYLEIETMMYNNRTGMWLLFKHTVFTCFAVVVAADHVNYTP